MGRYYYCIRSISFPSFKKSFIFIPSAGPRSPKRFIHMDHFHSLEHSLQYLHGSFTITEKTQLKHEPFVSKKFQRLTSNSFWQKKYFAIDLTTFLRRSCRIRQKYFYLHWFLNNHDLILMYWIYPNYTFKWNITKLRLNIRSWTSLIRHFVVKI